MLLFSLMNQNGIRCFDQEGMPGVDDPIWYMRPFWSKPIPKLQDICSVYGHEPIVDFSRAPKENPENGSSKRKRKLSDPPEESRPPHVRFAAVASETELK